jgi:hypothetical protein
MPIFKDNFLLHNNLLEFITLHRNSKFYFILKNGLKAEYRSELVWKI